MKKDVLLTQASKQEIAFTIMGLSLGDEIWKDFPS